MSQTSTIIPCYQCVLLLTVQCTVHAGIFSRHPSISAFVAEMPLCSLNRLFDVHIWIHTHFTCRITYQINIYDAVNKSTLWQFIVCMQFLVACLKFQVVCNVAWGAFAHFPVFHLKIPSLPPDSCPAAAAGRAITPQRHNTLSCICIHTATVFVFILSKSLEGN